MFEHEFATFDVYVIGLLRDSSINLNLIQKYLKKLKRIKDAHSMLKDKDGQPNVVESDDDAEADPNEMNQEIDEIERKSDNSQIRKRRNTLASIHPGEPNNAMIMKHETESGFAIPYNITPPKYKEEGQQPNKPYQTF